MLPNSLSLMIIIMKKILIFSIVLFAVVFQLKAQTGINTRTPHASSILEVDVSSLPANGKKGFLGPKVALTGSKDQTTVGVPALGLMVYNTVNAGTDPDNVVADRYYFWDGTKWLSLVGRKFIDEALIQKIFYSSSTATQTFTQANLNVTTAPGQNNLVNFDNTIINTGNIASLNNNLFTINKGGLYELSGFIQYNPNGLVTKTDYNGTTYFNDQKILNLKVQVSVSGTAGPWEDIAGSRYVWSKQTSTYFQTMQIPPTVYRLAQGNVLRVVIQNPSFAAGSFQHGNGTIATSTNSPVSRALRLQLLDYNL